MKARVKATGKIIEVKSKVVSSVITGEYLLKYVDQETGISYFEEELFFPKDLTDNPDYWTRLEHTYAGMAMQGILSNESIELDYKGNDGCIQAVATVASKFAHALVEKYKKEE